MNAPDSPPPPPPSWRGGPTLHPYDELGYLCEQDAD